MGRKKTEETRTNEIKTKLTAIFEEIDQNKYEVILPLIERAAFIVASLESLEAELKKTGWTETYTNGANQSGIKKSAAADAYMSLVKNYVAITKQLVEAVPPAQRKSKLQEMMMR